MSGAAAKTADNVATKPSAAVLTASTAAVSVVGTWASAYKPATGFLGVNSEFTRNVSAAPTNPSSATLVQRLATDVATRYGGIASFNVNQYQASFVTATATTPRKDVVYDDCQNKGHVPGEIYDVSRGGLFRSVPIPDDAKPAAGTDGELSVWDPVSDQLWELWKAVKKSDGWHACWGGRIDGWSQSNGVFPGTTGVAATGLAEAAGSIGIAEMQAGVINHAMTLVIPNAANYSLFSWPALRSDGSSALTDSTAIPEGTRFRLSSTVNVDSLNLTPIAKAVAKAAQKYGFVVADQSGSVSVIAESGATTAARTGVNPWTALMGGVPSYNIMKNFPWSQLQALPQDYGKQ